MNSGGHFFSTFRTGQLLVALITVNHPASALASDSSEIDAIRNRLDGLKVEQAQTAGRIAALEEALSRLAGSSEIKPGELKMAAAVSPSAPPRDVTVAPVTNLDVSGDIRVRYESNSGDRDGRNRDRGVLRARLRATYAASKWLTIGGELDTGDPDDPNSTDVTLSNFDDDFDVSLSQAFIRGTFGSFQVQAGKFPLPFIRTDLVWDADVNPQGLSTASTIKLSSALKLRATALYFLIDELATGPDSRMIGGQVAASATLAPSFQIELAASYYDYMLRSVTGADLGDIRSNRFAGGRYLSDYNLLNLVASATWSGFGARWPVRITGDYVRNLGADVGATGFNAELVVGRVGAAGDWRFGYGYSETGVDAVLAAFSHDNTSIATNYRQHALGIDYGLTAGLILNATVYRYRPDDPLYADPNAARDWLNRVRLNLQVAF